MDGKAHFRAFHSARKALAKIQASFGIKGSLTPGYFAYFFTLVYSTLAANQIVLTGLVHRLRPLRLGAQQHMASDHQCERPSIHAPRGNLDACSKWASAGLEAIPGSGSHGFLDSSSALVNDSMSLEALL